MKLCLCGKSSIDAWRCYDNRLSYVPVFGHTLNEGPTLKRAFPSVCLEPGCSLSDFRPDVDFVEAKDLARWGARAADAVHLLVDRSIRSQAIPNCRTHVISVPDNAASLFLEVEPGVCLTSPELTFLMMAHQMDFMELVLLGYELCGCYSIDPACEGGLRLRHPLSSVSHINKLIDEMGHIKGSDRARRALQFVLDGSGSPRETAIAVLLSLPNKYGGFGLPSPRMNVRLNLGASAASVWARSNAFDLVWKESKLVMEYDGRSGHTSFEQTDRDNTRRSALVVEGYTVFAITASQLENVEGFYSIARSVSKKLGHRIRLRDENFWGKHLSLRDKVLSSSWK